MRIELNTDQIQYYSERANEYEKIYDKPERQHDLAVISQYLKNNLKNKQVLEIACGTGYWTKLISETAKFITAGDINSRVLEIAKTKEYKCPVEFIKDDIYKPSTINKSFNSGFAGFIWSHIPKDELDLFLSRFISKIDNGSTVIIIDNEYVEGNSTPIAFYDDSGNSYQIRKLEDGSEHTVIKNYPSDYELKMLVKPYADAVEIERMEYLWTLKFIVA